MCPEPETALPTPPAEENPEPVAPSRGEKVLQVLQSIGREEDHQRVADHFAVIADATRLRLIVALATDPLCVGDLSRVVSLGQSATSHALRILRDRGIVQAERRGQQVVYRLTDRALCPLIAEGWRQALDESPPLAVLTSEQGELGAFTGEIRLEPKGKKKKKKKKKNRRVDRDES